MTTDTLTLADFLLARIAEDEAAAPRVRSCGSVHPQQDSMCLPDGRHPDPRTLAEYAAKRRIVYLHPEAVSPDMRTGAAWAHGEALRHLALVYADHPDYRQEWCP